MKNVYDIKKEKNLNFVFPTKSICDPASKRAWKGRALMVIHLHYADTLSVYLPYMENIPEGVDVIVTTSDSFIESELKAGIASRRDHFTVIRKKNRGRDISSFLVACREHIIPYEYFGFIHDKKEKSEIAKADMSHLVNELWENMLGSAAYVCNVLDFMEAREEIGVLAPPLSVGDYQANAFMNTWFKNFDNTKHLLASLGAECDLDPQKPPITLGTVFWAKTRALQKLLDKEWNYEDFDAEPLANDGTISHAIERCLAYVAQDAGYDTGWLMTGECAAVRDEAMTQLLGECFELLYREMGIRSPFQVVNYHKTKEEIRSLSERVSRIYIYGAGVYGKGCLRMVKNMGIHPKGFLVSSASGNASEIDGIFVETVSESVLTADCGVIIAVGVTNVNSVLQSIHNTRPGFENYVLFSQ